MTPYEINQVVKQIFENEWNACPIRWPNTPETPSPPYIEVFVRLGANVNAEIQGVGTRIGIVLVNIFTPLQWGTEQGANYGGMLEEMFRHRKEGDLVFENDLLPYTAEIGVEKSINAFQHQTTIQLFTFS